MTRTLAPKQPKVMHDASLCPDAQVEDQAVKRDAEDRVRILRGRIARLLPDRDDAHVQSELVTLFSRLRAAEAQLGLASSTTSPDMAKPGDRGRPIVAAGTSLCRVPARDGHKEALR